MTVKLIVLACGCLFLLLIMVLVLFRINEILLMAGMLLALMFVFMRITPVGEVRMNIIIFTERMKFHRAVWFPATWGMRE